MSNYAKLNQRLPIFDYGKNKEDTTMLSKYIDESQGFGTNTNNIDSNHHTEEERKVTKSHNYNTRSNNKLETRKLHLIENDELFGTIEYTKLVLKALKEAIGENEKVSRNF
jgi:hypothetical protein